MYDYYYFCQYVNGEIEKVPLRSNAIVKDPQSDLKEYLFHFARLAQSLDFPPPVRVLLVISPSKNRP